MVKLRPIIASASDGSDMQEHEAETIGGAWGGILTVCTLRGYSISVGETGLCSGGDA